MSSKVDGQVELHSTARGAAAELFERGFQEVIDNIADPNTANKRKRKLVIEFVFSPDDEGEDIGMDVNMKTSLAPVMPARTRIFIGRRSTGKAVGLEFDPRQRRMFAETPGAETVTPLRGVDGGKK